jgi:hypothetical protein
VALDQRELLVGQGRGLLEDRGRHGELADVMDEPTDRELAQPTASIKPARFLSPGAGDWPTAYASTTGWKPPQNIRLPSKGISHCIDSASAVIFSLAASRVSLSGYSIQLKMTVSSSLA